MTERRRPVPPPRPPRPRRGLRVVAWAVVAAVVALGRLVDREPDDADEPDVVREEMDPAAVPEDPEHPPVRVLATAPPPPARPAPPPAAKRSLPKPFQGMRAFASPLIMPRLTLPRVLVPRLTELSGLLARARPGEPIAVTLSAYCLQGSTRRGRPVRPGIIAADPRVFPLARHVELFSGGRFLGRFLVDDTGKRIRGTRIDIWTPDCDDARQFGTRSGVATLVARGAP